MKEIGDLLRKRREELGISLAAAQAATKIRMRYLEAIERGEDLSYPGEVYYRGFMKSYASFLGLDGAEVVARYKALKEAHEREAQAETSPPAAGAALAPEPQGASSPPVPPVTEPVPRPAAPQASITDRTRAHARRKQSSRQAAILALVIASCGLMYLQWYRNVGSHGPRAAPVPAAQPAGRASVEPQEPPAQASPSAQPATAPAQTPESEARPQPPAEPTPGIEFTREERSKNLTEISAKVESIMLVGEVQRGQCWVRVEADGALAQEAMLQPGTTHIWEARERLYIRVGAPAVMRLKLNGVDLGQAGPEGPARDFVITAAKGD